MSALIYRRTKVHFVRATPLIAAFSLGACASFGAPGPVAADRPGYTDTPTVIPAGALELEVGATDDRAGGAPGQPSTEYRTLGEILLRVGLGRRTELRLFGNSYATRMTDGAADIRGIEDVKVGAKVNLLSVVDSLHGLLPNVAFLVATTLATGATGVTAGAAQPEAKLAMNWTTPSPFSLYANFGYGAVETGVGRATRAWTSVAGWCAMNPKVSVFLEGLMIGRMSGAAGAGASGNDVDGGVAYLLNDRLQLDIRAGRGFGSATSRERFVGAGLARRW